MRGSKNQCGSGVSVCGSDQLWVCFTCSQSILPVNGHQRERPTTQKGAWDSQPGLNVQETCG